MSPPAVPDVLRALPHKDLRNQCRARGLNPGGAPDTLRERIAENMHATGNEQLFAIASDGLMSGLASGQQTPRDAAGERLSSRPSSRVSQVPGGSSQIHFGDYKAEYATQQYGTKELVHMPPPAQPPPSQPMSAYPGFDPSNDAPAVHDYGGKGQAPQAKLSNVEFGDDSGSAPYQLPSTTAHRSSVPGAPPPTITAASTEEQATSITVNDAVKPLLLKDLRIQLRARNLSPAGPVEDLRQRLADDMMASGSAQLAQDLSLLNPFAVGVRPPSAQPEARTAAASGRMPVGGHSTMSFGEYQLPSTVKDNAEVACSKQIARGNPAPAPYSNTEQGTPHVHNYESARGNYITDRPSSRVNEPPGGRCQIHFG